MNWEFWSENPWLTFIAICAIYYSLRNVLLILPNRYFRSRDIAAHGWPPPHCDADGDFRPKE